MGFFKEFKEFAMKGNVVDMAVGVIIGGAFGKIVTSLVNDVIMPPIGKLLGGVDFSNLKIVLENAKTAADGKVIPEVAIRYGAFINTILDFLIVALCIFFVIKGMNSLKKKEEPKPEEPKGPTETELLTEIRDLLKKES